MLLCVSFLRGHMILLLENILVESHVSLKIYNMLGVEVAELVNRILSPSAYSISFNASILESGIYFYRLTAREFSQTRKLVFLK
jgi:hypothetical protein